MNRRDLLAGAIGAGVLMEAATAKAGTDKVIRLWPGDAPGSEGVTVTETMTDNREKPDQPNRSFKGVRVPDLTIRFPEKPNGAAMLVLPGGGFNSVVFDKEGSEIAAWLATLGFTAGTLKYRLPADGWKAGTDVALQDGQRALRLMRQAVGGGKTGVIGFSAGGALGAMLATRFAERFDGTVDAADAQPARPDYAALIYPGYPADLAVFPPGQAKGVPADMPPVFIAHAADDPKAPPIASLYVANVLMNRKIPVELHLFETGNHGFALRRGPADRWPGLFDAWSKTHLKA